VPSAKEIRQMAKQKGVSPKYLSKVIYGRLRKTNWKKEHEERIKIWNKYYKDKYGKYTIEKARKLGLLPPEGSKPWKPPKHGDKSRYFHVRLKSPTLFDKFRTITVHKVKHVYARNKKTGLFELQNVMIPKSAAEVKNGKLIIKDKWIKEYLKKLGITSITKMKTGGSADFKATVKCPGGKIRSKGKGRGLGIGRGKGPIGKGRGAK